MRAIGFFYLGARNGDSLPELRQQFADFCDLNFHQPVNTFAADGEAAPRETPEYRRMIEYMRDSGSEFLVAVPDATHLGSDLESVARAFVELEQTGAVVRCFDEEFPDPLQNAFQTLGVKGVSRTRSRRIKESMQERALQGQALGRPPYGYRIGAEGKLEVVPDEARVVELIFRLYTRDLMGFRLIVQHLNERGILTRRGSNWNVIGIRDILRNPVYTGTYTRLGMRRPRTHEAIIPHDLFREARGVTESRRPLGRVSKSEPFLLSGSDRMRLLRQQDDGRHPTTVVEAAGRPEAARRLPLLPVPVQEQSERVRIPHVARAAARRDGYRAARPGAPREGRGRVRRGSRPRPGSEERAGEARGAAAVGRDEAHGPRRKKDVPARRLPRGAGHGPQSGIGRFQPGGRRPDAVSAGRTWRWRPSGTSSHPT